MPEADTSSLLQTLRWLSAHAGFPAARLPEKAELLVLIAAAAAQEERDAQNPIKGRPVVDKTFNAQFRNYTIQRRRVHVKCDNSAKV
jgi:hypothetical protein